MAINSMFPFGQIRRQSNYTYLNNVNPTPSVRGYQTKPSDNDSQGIIFEDQMLDSSNNPFVATNNYFLKVKITRLPSEQRFNVKLQTSDSGDESSVSQYIGKYVIPSSISEDEEYSILELVFTPKNSFNFLVFTLERTIQDDYNISTSNYAGRTTKIEVISCQYFENIIPGKTLIKVGIQTTPGMLFCINGEAIRVGPSGIYEINNGYEVTFIGAAVSNNNGQTSEGFYDYEYFTIDYRQK